jgi:hypothetical protein
VPGRQRAVVGNANQRLRVGINVGRPVAADQRAQPDAPGVRDGHSSGDVEEQERASLQEGRYPGNREPDGALGARIRERDEDRVEPPDPMLDDPALDLSVE